MKINKSFSFGIITIVLLSCFALIGCSDVSNEQGNNSTGKSIPSQLMNTTWTRQINDSETLTLNFGTDTMTVSTDEDSGDYIDEWDYRGGSCCGNGYCGFGGGGGSMGFNYTCDDETLCISNCGMKSLNGEWTRA